MSQGTILLAPPASLVAQRPLCRLWRSYDRSFSLNSKLRIAQIEYLRILFLIEAMSRPSSSLNLLNMYFEVFATILQQFYAFVPNLYQIFVLNAL
jgi:hypothetical protein